VHVYGFYGSTGGGSGYFCGGRVVYRLSLWGWGWALGALQLEADFLTKSFIVFQVI